MPTAASGVNKRVIIKKQTNRDTVATATGARLLRRVEAFNNLGKDLYESDEIRTDFQTADERHGVRRVSATLNAELSPGSYSDLVGSLLKRDFTAVTSLTGLSLTIAAAVAPAWTITRSTGSWLTDGVKVGRVCRLTAGTFNALNLNKNLLVTAVTALNLTVVTVNGSAMAAQGTAVTGATLAFPGKVTFTPETGHTNDAYTVEEFWSDVNQSEVYSGVQYNKAAISLPPTGMSRINFTGMGKDLAQTGTTQYFTSPTALGSSGVAAAINGALILDGVRVASLTSLSMDAEAAYEGDPTVGSNTIEYMTPGAIKFKGQFTAYFENRSIDDRFVSETPAAVVVVAATSSADAAEFVAFTLTRVKLNSADKSDAKAGQQRTYSFTAIKDINGGAAAATEATTLLVQDSLA